MLVFPNDDPRYSAIRKPLAPHSLTNGLGQVIVIADAIPRAGILGDVETHAQFPPEPAPTSDGKPSAPVAPPPGSYLAPGTSNVFIFQGSDPAPLPASETPLASTEAAAAEPDKNDTTAGDAAQPAASPNDTSPAPESPPPSVPESPPADDGKQNAAKGGGEPPGADSSPSPVYSVAGFDDADGDGIADKKPDEIGMPDAPAAPGASRVPAAVVAAAPAPVYSPAPAEAGGPQHLPRPLMAP